MVVSSFSSLSFHTSVRRSDLIKSTWKITDGDCETSSSGMALDVMDGSTYFGHIDSGDSAV